MLNARLAAAESMTHDVIRDLLGVKLDINNYAVSLKLSTFSNKFPLQHCSFVSISFLQILELD